MLLDSFSELGGEGITPEEEVGVFLLEGGQTAVWAVTYFPWWARSGLRFKFSWAGDDL